jgi:hypothetical protein
MVVTMIVIIIIIIIIIIIVVVVVAMTIISSLDWSARYWTKCCCIVLAVSGLCMGRWRSVNTRNSSCTASMRGARPSSCWLCAL